MDTHINAKEREITLLTDKELDAVAGGFFEEESKQFTYMMVAIDSVIKGLGEGKH